MTLECTGYGAGTRTYERFPNVLRLLLGETSEATAGREPSADNLLLIETNLDDVSPQILGFLMERTLDAGALDCWFTPIQMKKNRPATLVSILCPVEKRAEISKLLYSETTTLGLRINHIERECLPREFVKVKTTFGEIDVKIARQDGRVVNAMPEYDQVRRLALENQVPFHTVRDSALKALEQDIKASAAEK
jgi:hypothetical protein